MSKDKSFQFGTSALEVTCAPDLLQTMMAAKAAVKVLEVMHEIDLLYRPALLSGIKESAVSENFDQESYLNNLIGKEGFDPASARLLLNAEVTRQREQSISGYYQKNVKPAEMDDPLFDTIENPGNSPLYQKALAALYLAVRYEDNEKGAIKDGLIDNKFKISDYKMYALEYADGFKAVAVEVLNEAAEKLRGNNYTAMAEQMQSTVEKVYFNPVAAQEKTPRHFSERMVDDELTRIDALQMYCQTSINAEWQSTMLSRGQLASPAPFYRPVYPALKS